MTPDDVVRKAKEEAIKYSKDHMMASYDKMSDRVIINIIDTAQKPLLVEIERLKSLQDDILGQANRRRNELNDAKKRIAELESKNEELSDENFDFADKNSKLEAKLRATEQAFSDLKAENKEMLSLLKRIEEYGLTYEVKEDIYNSLRGKDGTATKP